MMRRALLATLTLALLTAPLAAEAQQARKVYRLGILNPGAPTPEGRGYLFDALRELGYVEGQNLEIVRRYAEGGADRLPALATELVERRVGAILASSSVAVRAAQEATKTIPIVILVANDPIEMGLVPSLARPGGNVTGVVLGALLVGKRLELLREAVPRAARIAMLFTNESALAQVEEARQAAARAGVKLVAVEAKGRDYDRAFAAMRRERPDALLVGSSPVLNADRKRTSNWRRGTGCPRSTSGQSTPRRAGSWPTAPASAGPTGAWPTTSIASSGGARPADLPVEQATEVRLAVNLKTAKALGLTIPPSVLVRADEIIQ